MSVDITISIKDGATPALEEKIKACDPHRVATRIAPPLARHWRDHLASRPPNKHGYPSTGFWEDSARRVVGIAVADSVLLKCDKVGVRQRLHGGPIAARDSENLTIPIAQESYGTTVADWGRDNLTLVVYQDSGRKFLVLDLTSQQAQDIYAAAGVGRPSKKIGPAVRRVHRLRGEELIARARGAATERRKVIVLRSAGSGRDMGRDEKHLNLKFLFLLKREVDQPGDPDVVPEDLGEVARGLVLEAIK